MGIGGPATSALSIMHRHGELDDISSVIEIGAQDLNESHISFVLNFPLEIPIKIYVVASAFPLVAFQFEPAFLNSPHLQ